MNVSWFTDVERLLPYPAPHNEPQQIIVTIERTGRLYVVATPIGNLGDLSSRAREILQTCSLIAAEDTRHTGTLLKHFGIQTPQLSVHDHNERQRAPEVIQKLREGAHIALVSDAGTPGISDPGFELVRAVAAAGFEVVAVPGPCAAIAALSIGGLPTDRFCFEGFLPARGAARRKRLQSLVPEQRTLVLYEAPHRLAETLSDAADILGSRHAVVAREVTKIHEEFLRGTLAELRDAARKRAPRGEITLLIAPAVEGEPQAVPAVSLKQRVEQLEAEAGLDRKAALKMAARERGLGKREAYKQLLLER